jgi:hypothetical protein
MVSTLRCHDGGGIHDASNMSPAVSAGVNRDTSC